MIPNYPLIISYLGVELTLIILVFQAQGRRPRSHSAEKARPDEWIPYIIPIVNENQPLF